jgi:hypothetical protein
MIIDAMNEKLTTELKISKNYQIFGKIKSGTLQIPN